MEYVFGITLGVLCCVLFLLVYGKMFYKKQYKDKPGIFQEKKVYDERQLMARGRAYKGGFFSLMISVTLLLLVNEVTPDVNIMNYSGVICCIIASVAIFAIICIIKDAYMSLYESTKNVAILFVLIGLFNVVIGFSELFSEGIIVKDEATGLDELSDCVGSLAAGFALLIICAIFLAKVSYDKKVASEDEFEEE